MAGPGDAAAQQTELKLPSADDEDDDDEDQSPSSWAPQLSPPTKVPPELRSVRAN